MNVCTQIIDLVLRYFAHKVCSFLLAHGYLSFLTTVQPLVSLTVSKYINYIMSLRRSVRLSSSSGIATPDSKAINSMPSNTPNGTANKTTKPAAKAASAASNRRQSKASKGQTPVTDSKPKKGAK